MEVHGDVFDVCRTARTHLSPDGRFCLVHLAADPRPERAVEQAGLQVLSRRDVVFRFGRPPMIAIWVCGHDGTRQDEPALTIRDADHRWTADYRAVRDSLEMAS